EPFESVLDTAGGDHLGEPIDRTVPAEHPRGVHGAGGPLRLDLTEAEIAPEAQQGVGAQQVELRGPHGILSASRARSQIGDVVMRGIEAMLRRPPDGPEKALGCSAIAPQLPETALLVDGECEILVCDRAIADMQRAGGTKLLDAPLQLSRDRRQVV